LPLRRAYTTHTPCATAPNDRSRAQRGQPQEPFTQILLGGQTLLHAPQCWESLLVSVHWPMQ
jgi:hypothetical protein